MKAYILSRHYGTVQIGNRVFQPSTGAIFEADRKGLRHLGSYDVPDASMESARMALREDAKIYH